MSELPPCVHAVLEGNLHEFVFTGVSRAAVDSFIEQFEPLVRQTAPEDTLRFITWNGANKPQPMSYALAQTRILLRSLPTRPAIRAALVENSFFAKLLNTMFQAVLTRPRDRLRVFHSSQREEMLAWLHRND